MQTGAVIFITPLTYFESNSDVGNLFFISLMLWLHLPTLINRIIFLKYVSRRVLLKIDYVDPSFCKLMKEYCKIADKECMIVFLLV